MVYGMKWVFALLIFPVISGCSSVDEKVVLFQLNEIITTSSELFQNHSSYGDMFYNEQYHTLEEIERLLDGKVTEDGLLQMVERIFDENDNILVYKQPFQTYIKESNVYNSSINETNAYYDTVRKTILNPGLRLITEEELQFEVHDEIVIVKGENINIEFYNIEMYGGSAEQYARYGYPANDVLSVSFKFVKDTNGYLLDSFHIEDGEITS
ncbi:hypothetical protein [Alkalihalobacillus sp. BA299]|uniref:hypothetical protein n=1 Tax=Alkalihalobacillus sp. BA299 TaxID=2815938 RepID=UPI001ADCECE5|nr:hypothetical protein [Alkalihalobacillus sp. BA299]